MFALTLCRSCFYFVFALLFSLFIHFYGIHIFFLFRRVSFATLYESGSINWDKRFYLLKLYSLSLCAHFFHLGVRFLLFIIVSFLFLFHLRSFETVVSGMYWLLFLRLLFSARKWFIFRVIHSFFRFARTFS